MPKETVVINLFGGPGLGKSTLASGVYYELSRLGYRAELVTEYAKDKVWEEHLSVLDNDQLYLLAKQNRRQLILNGKVDFIITDAPLLMNIAYMKPPTDTYILRDLIVEKFLNYDNLNFILERRFDYDEVGRAHTQEEAINLDSRIRSILLNYVHTDTCYAINPQSETAKDVVTVVLQKIKHNQHKARI